MSRDAGESRGVRIRRFDADRKDREITLEQAVSARLGERQLLWIDLGGAVDGDDLTALGERFQLEEETRAALAEPRRRPHLAVHGSYFHLSVAGKVGHSPTKPPTWLDVVAGQSFVITRHDGEITGLEALDARISEDASLGATGGVELVAMLLDHVVTGYFEAIDEIEDAIDTLDASILRHGGQAQLLERLVRLRRRIAGLRRLFAAHREPFAAVSGPDLRQFSSDDESAEDLKGVTRRFETAVGAVEASREALLGSFDVYMTRTAQRTNEIIKVLTIATVVVLPGSLVAGLLGMNLVVPLASDDPLSFWLVVGGIAVLAFVILASLRLRRWI